MKKIAIAFVSTWLLIGAVYAYEPTETSQIGADGVAMQVTQTEDELAARVEANTVPPAIPMPQSSGVLAAEEYENVQVLGHLNTAQFTRLMTSITLWVAPEQGCAYCHNTNNLASDELYTKRVARRMIQMTWHINENWQSHVQETGVTCYTCHRGNNVPQHIWFETPPDDHGMVGWRGSQNAPNDRTGISSLPNDVFEVFLEEDASIRVQSAGEAFPNENRASIKQAEWTYGLMMHFSESLGVNCTACHNSRSWNDWSQSPARRGTAWHGIRMARNLNNHWLTPLRDQFPPNRLGELGDAPKANCATCHQGAYRPLLGHRMLEDFPSLVRAMPQPEIEPEPEPEPELEDEGEAGGQLEPEGEAPAAEAPEGTNAAPTAMAAPAAMAAPTGMAAPAAMAAPAPN